MPDAGRWSLPQATRILACTAVLLAPLLPLAPLGAQRTPRPSREVSHVMVFTVGPLMRVVPGAPPREVRNADGTRELVGHVQVTANLQCRLRIEAGDGSTHIDVPAGVSTHRYRILVTGSATTIRYDLQPVAAPFPTLHGTVADQAARRGSAHSSATG